MLAEHFKRITAKKCSAKTFPIFYRSSFCRSSEPPELAQRQQTFITEFAKDGWNTYGTFSQWDQPADPARGLKQAIEAIKFEITVLAGKPTNLPYTSLGTLFKGRDEFLAELRQHLTAKGPVVIKGKRTWGGHSNVLVLTV